MTEHLPLNNTPMPVRLRIEDYLLLDRSGAFEDYAKTELIEGEIVFMNAQHRPHVRVKMGLYDAIRDALVRLDSSLRAFVEASVEVPPHSAPEPDILLTREPDGQGLVPVASVALIVEVADTTLANDLERKGLLYASHGIPEYWVADVNARTIHQMWSPASGGYAERREVRFGERLESASIAGLTIATSGLE